MSAIEGIFSIRIVIVDFYLEKPTFSLDPCYSELRGREIKRVPIIRIFGANGNGQKTCMHVHGVFPYFYIPYEKKDFESLQHGIFQIATSLDKAINISLGQSSSNAQHVFKIQLVKGIPFYGYHRSEHQYLKIYMFNPRFVRRAANLLQNGAILNRNYNPHESHVPYILQFMIDYNLYGMSFLHVPMEIVKFRQNSQEDEIPYPNVHSNQILDTLTCKKVSCSKIEVDIGSNFILNRIQLICKTNQTHTNPGIEAIWNDEHMRRQNLITVFKDDMEKQLQIPALEVPPTQERPKVEIAESEIFHRAALVSKLLAMESLISANGSLSDQTINALNITTSNPKEQKRKFNLKKILGNLVYPEECTQEDQLANASFIENHLSKTNAFQESHSGEKQPSSVDLFLNDTIIDEEIVLSLTQPAPLLDANLRQEDMELLNLLQQLEEQNQIESHIDLDSSLAPLSQQLKEFELTPELLDKETIAAAVHQPISDTDSGAESDNEVAGNLHDFSIALDDIDELLLKISQSQTMAAPKQFDKVPQIDGSDDLVLVTPKKHCKTTQRTPPQTPRTPKTKTAAKYTPLPLIYINKSAQKTENTSPIKDCSKDQCKQIDCNISGINYSLRRKLESTEMRRKSISVVTEEHPEALYNTKKLALAKMHGKSNIANTEAEAVSKTKTTGRSTIKPKDLNKTHIVCNIRPSKKNKCNELRLFTPQKDASKKSVNKQNIFNESSKDSNSTATCQNKLLKRYSNKLSINVNQTTDNFQTSAIRRSSRNIIKKQAEVILEKQNSSPTSSESCFATRTNRRTSSGSKSVKSKNKSYNKALTRDTTLTVRKDKRKSPRNHITQKRHVQNSNLSDVVTCQSSRHKEGTQKIKNKNKNNKETETDNETVLKIDKAIKKHPIVRIARLKLNKILKENDCKLNHKQCVSLQNCISTNATLQTTFKEHTMHSEEEAIESDTESVATVTKLRATPNLRCLRNSFRKSLLAKRQTLIESDEKLKVTLTAIDKDYTMKENDANDYATEHAKHFSPSLSDMPNDDEAILMQSFYENSFISNYSPSIFSDDVPSPIISNDCNRKKTPSSLKMSIENFIKKAKLTRLMQSENSTNTETNDSVVITPLNLPPTYEEVLKGCKKFNIHEHEFQQPFYSNPDDITKAKEVGFTMLRIPGNKLNDCQEFQSLLYSDGALNLKDWRRKQMIALGGSAMLKHYRHDTRIREYFASDISITIEPQQVAPSKHDAKLWLKARELLRQKELDALDNLNNRKRLEQDSPIKIRRQKVALVLNENDSVGIDAASRQDAETNDMDCSTCDLTLTPMTPSTPIQTNKELSTLQSESLTPLTSRTQKTKSRIRISLNAKLKSAAEAEKCTNKIRCISNEQLMLTNNNDNNELICSSGSLKSSQTSESSICSQAAVEALERSSFLQTLKKSKVHEQSFGLSNTTLNNTFGFKVNLENLQQAKADTEYNYLTIMTLEVFVCTRNDLYPDPVHDELRCLFYAIENSIPTDDNLKKPQLPTKACGYIIVNDGYEGHIHGIDADIEVKVVNSEIEALETLLELCAQWDPDIYAGYEIEMHSWGFVIERAKHLCFNIASMLSRVPSQKTRDFVDEDREHFTDLDVEMKICGRILLDVWRLMRSEIALTSYTFENVMYHIMHKRCPCHSFRSLTQWFKSPCSRWIVIEYYLERVRGTLALLEQLDLIGRTSEMAKLIGIQFYEVLSRGSQFRVESMMLRIAKPKNLVPLSPSVQQRAHMRAPEYLPLIMEPESRFYADPVIVLDFQSLYPSMIIAYNYCFSTCLGRVEHLGESEPFEFAASQLRVPPKLLKKLLDENLITISPCGVVFVKPSVREGILPCMLREILDTRIMVKQSMKLHKNNSALQRILHSRQLGLKLMANVTYGYTAANFSGRMPAVEVGDTVVAKGRETLERAIKLVEANEKWDVRVVYGDTDSMFVLVPGRNREQAFKIGEEIAEAVTKVNPHPVKLKLEKVYQPCILQTKKRYVGYMYETPDQTEPVYEAKGIETVRRDGCPAVAKMLEKVLRILFETADVSQIKHYVCRQFTKLLTGRANLQDLIFAKEFRGLNGYKSKACVPALELTRKWIQTDPRHIPRHGERVPFIIINGPPGVPLIRLVRSPNELLTNEGYKINAIYYITKAIIPPLNRCLLLIGADINEWFSNLPRKLLCMPALSNANEIINHSNAAANQQKKSTISQYFSNTNCVTDCGRQTKEGICNICLTDAQKCVITLQSKMAKYERSYHLTQQICAACCGRVGDLQCASLDCPVLFVLEGKRRDLQQIIYFRKLLEQHF